MEDPARLAPNERIAKIEKTTLGIEDHGILTCWLHCSYGSSGQGVGGYALDDVPDQAGDRSASIECGKWVLGILRACGVDSWEKLPGRQIIVMLESDSWNAMPYGIRPLPTERGKPFIFRAVEA